MRPVFLTAAILLLAVPVANAATPFDVVADCADDGVLDGKYTDAERQAALNEIPADLEAYGECREIIGAGIGRGKGKESKGSSGRAGGGSGSGSGAGAGSGSAPRAGDGGSGERADRRGGGDEDVAGRVVRGTSGTGGGTEGDGGAGIPGWLLAALGAGALVALGGARELRRRS
jgi:hypothetical protein